MGRTYGRRGREVCKLGKVPISIALCQSTTTAGEIVAALNSNADLLAALRAWIAHRKAVFDAQMRGTLDEIPTDRINEIVSQAETAIAKAEKHSKAAEDGT